MGSRTWCVVALLTLAAGCGGTDAEVDTVTGETSGDNASPASVAAEALVDQWGSDREAFYVVAWSLDAGYSAGQIIEAAPLGRIQASGEIADADGTPLQPANEPAGLLTVAEGQALGLGVAIAAAVPARSSALILAADDEPQDARVPGLGQLSDIHDGAPTAFESRMAKLREDDPLTPWEELALQQTELITQVTLELGARGYSGRQILDAILRGNWVQFHTEEPPGGCWYVLAGKGGYGAAFVTPEYAPVDPLHELECAHEIEKINEEWVALGSTTTSEPSSTTTSSTIATTTTTEEPRDDEDAFPLPRTFSGEGTYTISWSFSPDSCRQDGQTLEVTLNEDGSATGFMHFLSPSTQGFIKSVDGSYTGGECAGSANEFDLELTGSYVLPAPGNDRPGSFFLDLEGQRRLEGTFDANGMSVAYRMDVFMEQFAANTGLPDPRLYGDYEFPMMEVMAEG